MKTFTPSVGLFRRYTSTWMNRTSVRRKRLRTASTTSTTRTRDRHVSDEDPGRTDALCLRPRPLERSRPERPRHEHARTRRLHLSCVVADDEERDAHVAGRVVERAADQADALTAGMPEGVEAPTGRARRGAVRLRGRGAAAEHEHGESSRERPAHAPTLASYPLPSAKFIGFSGPATPPR